MVGNKIVYKTVGIYKRNRYRSIEVNGVTIWTGKTIHLKNDGEVKEKK